MLLFALDITVWDGQEVFSSVPRLTGWFFQRLIYGGVPPASPERLAMAGRLAPSAFPSTDSGLRLPPLIRREKDSGLRLGRLRQALRLEPLGHELEAEWLEAEWLEAEWLRSKAQAPSQPRGARRGPPVTAEKTS